MAKDVHELIRSLGFDRVNIAAADVGAMVAYSFAAHHPEATNKLAIWEGGPYRPEVYEHLSVFPKDGEPNVWWYPLAMVKGLPEKLLAGRFRHVIDATTDAFSLYPERISEESRAIYAASYDAPEAVAAAFRVYTSVHQDMADYDTYAPLTMPTLVIGARYLEFVQLMMEGRAEDVRYATDVDHRGEVEPGRADGDVGDVAAPPGVQGVRGEVAHHQVRHGRRGPVRDRRPLLLPQVPSDDVVDPHQPGHALAVDPPSPRTQLGMDARGTIGAIVRGVDGADLAHGPLLLGLALDAGLPGGQMAVVAGAGHTEHPADPLDAEIGAVVGDEVPAARAHFTSRAKYAAARRRISRSRCHSFSAFSSGRSPPAAGPAPPPGRPSHGVRARPGSRPCAPTSAATPR